MIGGLAAFLTMNYVKGVENENAAANQLVDVLVAKGPIPKGTSADAALAAQQITVDKRRQADLPAQAVRRNAEIAEQVAAVDLGGGEIITSTMFVADSDLTGSKSTSIDKGNVAVTISVDDAAGVAGLIQPGDSINIMANVALQAEGSEASAEEGLFRRLPVDTGDDFQFSKPSVYAFQNVKVLAIGQTLGVPVAQSADGAPVEEAPIESNGLITVQLPPDKAVLLASMRNSGLYLTLNRPDYEPVPSPLVSNVPELPGETGTPTYPDASAQSDGQ